MACDLPRSFERAYNEGEERKKRRKGKRDLKRRAKNRDDFCERAYKFVRGRRLQVTRREMHHATYYYYYHHNNNTYRLDM